MFGSASPNPSERRACFSVLVISHPFRSRSPPDNIIHRLSRLHPQSVLLLPDVYCKSKGQSDRADPAVSHARATNPMRCKTFSCALSRASCASLTQHTYVACCRTVRTKFSKVTSKRMLEPGSEHFVDYTPTHPTHVPCLTLQ